jgi:hypothetical protein
MTFADRPMPTVLQTDVLVVGAGAGGTAAAIQAARQGVDTILVGDGPWLGGMLTSAGVSAPDGNELEFLQTGIWGAFLRELERRHPEGLDHGWVSFFNFDPAIGAAIFADWVVQLPNLRWIQPQTPQQVLREGDRIAGVVFPDYRIEAKVTIDATELGDLLALGQIPHRWGWELKPEFGEPSAPDLYYDVMERYPLQVPTWVVVMRDYGVEQIAPAIPKPPNYDRQRYVKAWTNYGEGKIGGEICLNYGQLPGNRFMMNWPTYGNDYGEGVARLLGSESDRQAYFQEAIWQSQGFAHYIQTELDARYGLAIGTFPTTTTEYGLTAEARSAFALHPYYRESRRLVGLTTIREQDLLPHNGLVAPLPITTCAAGCENVEQGCDAIAVGNYVLDHHYPSGDIKLSPKSTRWGGRWTGTPFTIPYRSLIPQTIDGFLSCEKNIAVTHMANGATRLQPLVLNIGQAAGMAAALSVQQAIAPRHLSVRSIQTALIEDPIAPSAVIPLYNLPPNHPEWLTWQNYYLDHIESYPLTGLAPIGDRETDETLCQLAPSEFSGQFLSGEAQSYRIRMNTEEWQLVTLNSRIQHQLLKCRNEHDIRIQGRVNRAGKWILVTKML